MIDGRERLIGRDRRRGTHEVEAGALPHDASSTVAADEPARVHRLATLEVNDDAVFRRVEAGHDPLAEHFDSERFGVPRTLDDLGAHRLIHYTTTLGTRPAGWEYFDGERYAQWPMEGVLTVNNADAYQAACLAGLGLIQAPESGVRALLADGALQEVLPEFQAEPLAVTLLYANRRHLPRRAQAFMNWLADLLTPRLTSP